LTHVGQAGTLKFVGNLSGDGPEYPGAAEFAIIDRRYLLVSSIACYVDAGGAVWVEPLWRLDLLEHLSYLKDFVLCAPRRRWVPGLDLVRFEVSPGTRFAYAFLPSQVSFLRALFQLPRTIAALWGAIGRSDIVHSSVIGWPFPLGWLANPFALIRRKRLVVVVESSWLMEGAERADWKHRLMDMNLLRASMARWSCTRASLALFTQATYRDALDTPNAANAHVTPAVWVNEADILDDETARVAWTAKEGRPVRFLFAGRLVALKGVEVLLEALRLLEGRGARVTVDIIGQGVDRAACARAAAEFRSVGLTVLDPVPYGATFFELVRGYHAVLIPSVSDEQPRILFDANAQAVPVIASDTDGMRPYVQPGRTGWLVPAGDAAALASAIARADGAASDLGVMGLAALRVTRGFTHRAMHLHRSHLLRQHCG
jgi:glycosyltransferase involved in cell wall biosynthesis